MAIQIWDAQAGQYKSADLARFGGSGTLKEALVWDGTQYVKVWPTGPTYTWEDDFTAPVLHERWTIIEGEYAPPGLTAGVLGPDLGDSFEITVTGSLVPDGVIVMLVADENFGTVEMLQIDYDMRLSNLAGQTSTPGASGGSATLRRADGQWSILVNNEVVIDTNSTPMSVPDAHTGPAVLAISAASGATVTHIGYRAL